MSMVKMVGVNMARSVGIDIGSKSLKIVELEASGSKLKITNCIEIDLPF